MGKSTHGLDGWRVAELKVLGLAAWGQRARIIKVQLSAGRVPASFRQVTTPMLPKIRATEEIMEHRGLAVFSVLWRIESSAWYVINACMLVYVHTCMCSIVFSWMQCVRAGGSDFLWRSACTPSLFVYLSWLPDDLPIWTLYYAFLLIYEFYLFKFLILFKK